MLMWTNKYSSCLTSAEKLSSLLDRDDSFAYATKPYGAAPFSIISVSETLEEGTLQLLYRSRRNDCMHLIRERLLFLSDSGWATVALDEPHGFVGRALVSRDGSLNGRRPADSVTE